MSLQSAVGFGMKRGGRHKGSPMPVIGRPLKRLAPESAGKILASAAKDRTDRPLAIAAKCVQCRGGSDEGVRACADRDCALWLLRPYRVDGPPRSAPHLDRPEPTYERAWPPGPSGG